MNDLLDYLDEEEDLRRVFQPLEQKSPWPKVEVARPEDPQAEWDRAMEIITTAVHRFGPRAAHQPTQKAANLEGVPYAFRHLLEIGEW